MKTYVTFLVIVTILILYKLFIEQDVLNNWYSLSDLQFNSTNDYLTVREAHKIKTISVILILVSCLGLLMISLYKYLTTRQRRFIIGIILPIVIFALSLFQSVISKFSRIF